ncbi:hypothetical protein H2201_003966 [Coniosporium apollinis]|uniref:deoxyribose-phosphate aldolase n=1 Tax=Coniosporium apollinis TaxID=61459 RepID=A0ABQ9P0B7_9PEZI|nr:hypothetical protein H2201_003966 [Coniosporium apollinis]
MSANQPPHSAAKDLIPPPTMTARYTNSEWAARIKETEKSLSISKERHPVPRRPEDVAKFIDHTLLKLDATGAQIDGLCAEARNEGFKTVCVRLNFVARAVSNLRGSPVGVACVIGFHEGTQDLTEKIKEAHAALSAGATELDIVLNHPLLTLPSPSYEEIYVELASLRNLAPSPVCLKLILETSQLSPQQITAACVLASAARFDFVKTSTGFNGRGASEEDVRRMSSAAALLAANERDGAGEGGAARMQVKASGGIRGWEDCRRMLECGATRIGTSSGVWIMRELREREKDAEKGGRVAGGKRPGVTRLYTDEEVGGY